MEELDRVKKKKQTLKVLDPVIEGDRARKERFDFDGKSLPLAQYHVNYIKVHPSHWRYPRKSWLPFAVCT